MSFIPVSQPTITKLEIDYVTDAVSSGWVSSLGKYIDIFEQRFAEFCGTNFALSVSNGTTGLHLALTSLGIGPGDEVIIPDLTFIATANAIAHCGATVVVVDVERRSLCIDPESIKKAINSKTKAIIPVHLYGHPANMPEIMRLAKEHNLKVIEDAAEAHGAMIGSKKVGSFGDCGVFSFYGNKIITCGEGGMITTNNAEFYQKAKLLRDHAMSKEKRFWHLEIGFNYRMTNLQAALGLAQLERIESILIKKIEIFKYYQDHLSGVNEIQLNYEASWAKNVFWMICIEIFNSTEQYRDDFIVRLKERGIDSRPYFYPVSKMPMYFRNTMPVSNDVHKIGLNLPSFYDMTKEEISFICMNVKELLDNKK